MNSKKVGFVVTRKFQNKRKEDGAITFCRYVWCKEGLGSQTKEMDKLPNIESRPELIVMQELEWHWGRMENMQYITL